MKRPSDQKMQTNVKSEATYIYRMSPVSKFDSSSSKPFQIWWEFKGPTVAMETHTFRSDNERLNIYDAKRRLMNMNQGSMAISKYCDLYREQYERLQYYRFHGRWRGGDLEFNNNKETTISYPTSMKNTNYKKRFNNMPAKTLYDMWLFNLCWLAHNQCRCS